MTSSLVPSRHVITVFPPEPVSLHHHLLVAGRTQDAPSDAEGGTERIPSASRADVGEPQDAMRALDQLSTKRRPRRRPQDDHSAWPLVAYWVSHRAPERPRS